MYCAAGREGEAAAESEARLEADCEGVKVLLRVEVVVALPLPLAPEVAVTLAEALDPRLGEAEFEAEAEMLTVCDPVKLEFPLLEVTLAVPLNVGMVEVVELRLALPVVL